MWCYLLISGKLIFLTRMNPSYKCSILHANTFAFKFRLQPFSNKSWPNRVPEKAIHLNLFIQWMWTQVWLTRMLKWKIHLTRLINHTTLVNSLVNWWKQIHYEQFIIDPMYKFKIIFNSSIVCVKVSGKLSSIAE